MDYIVGYTNDDKTPISYIQILNGDFFGERDESIPVKNSFSYKTISVNNIKTEVFGTKISKNLDEVINEFIQVAKDILFTSDYLMPQPFVFYSEDGKNYKYKIMYNYIENK